MAATFSKTLRALGDDKPHRSSVTMIAGALVVASWIAWSALAKVTVVEVSENARLETAGVARPIQPSVTGKVKVSRIELGRVVQAGDVLLELDDEVERLALAEAKDKLGSDERQLVFLHKELVASEAAQKEERQAMRAAVASSRAHAAEAAARSRVAAEEAKRLGALQKDGHAGEMEAMRAAADAASQKALAEARVQDAARAAADVGRRESERRASIDQLYRTIAALEGEKAQLARQIERLELEIERRKVRSPVAGRIGEVTALREGAVVQAGAPVGAVVPDGDLRVVAEFASGTAVGRIKPGMHAQIRLAGFNWAEYGTLRATVKSVAEEPRDGRIRAELELDRASSSERIPEQHGLTGVAEVEIERIAPARLVLRTVGASLAPPARAAAPAATTTATKESR
jgi:membrane fusion protein (multidrug efflux system)